MNDLSITITAEMYMANGEELDKIASLFGLARGDRNDRQLRDHVLKMVRIPWLWSKQDIDHINEVMTARSEIQKLLGIERMSNFDPNLVFKTEIGMPNN